jgi:PAS domain S-box-containing protein
MNTNEDAMLRSSQRPPAGDEYVRRLELAVQNSTHMVVVTNGRREIEWVNPAYTNVTGWTLDEVRGRNPRSFLHGPRTSMREAARLSELLRAGCSVKDFEMLNHKKSGEPYWVSMSIQPIRDAAGEITEYVSVQTDVTQSRRRELEIARLLRRLSEAQRIAKLGCMEHDLATGRVHCSAEIFRILDTDAPEGDASYESLMACTHPHDLDDVRDRYEKAITDGAMYESEHRIVSRAGRVKWVHVTGFLEGWVDGTPALYRLMVRDISERKQAEQLAHENERLAQAAREQVEVVSRVSHELRTPLHAVHGFAELVERQEWARLSERSKGHLRDIRSCVRHLTAVVNDILDLTSLQSGRVPLQMAPVELASVTRDVATMLEPLAAERGIDIDVAAPAAPLTALADRRRVVQVLINLMGNAIKYNRAGSRVTVRFRAEGPSSVGIEVEDHGFGIPAEHLGRLFEPFYRAHDGRRSAPCEGTGLGLAIAKNLAQAMGGDISARSRLGHGSSFLLTLQASCPAEAGPIAGPRPAATAPPAAGVLLYVEDNEVNRLLVERFLQGRPDVELQCRATGAAGLEAARALHPKLILVDLDLPDMTGHEFVRYVLDDPELQRTPCVAYSADAGSSAVEDAICNGFREHLGKPIGIAEFLAAVDRLMQDRAAAPA